MQKQPYHLKRVVPSEWEGVAIRERSILSVRSTNFQSVIFDTLHLNPHEKTVLHIGGRRGLFAQEMVRRGFHVTVVDNSESAIAIARELAKQEQLALDLLVGNPKHLRVYCSDTLGVTDNLNAAEASRVLKKDGPFLHDTVSRTLFNRLVYLFIFQNWSWTNIMPKNRYNHNRLVPPLNLRRIMGMNGLENH